MRTLSSALTNALAAGTVVLVTLVKIEFPGGTVALNTSNWDFDIAGVIFRGAYGLGSISPITDQPGEVQGLQLELSGAAASSITLALDAADDVQGAPVTIGTLLIDPTTGAIVDVVMVDWVGRADTMSVSEDGETASVRLTAESRAVDLLRGNPLTYSQADQETLYAGDLAFRYVTDQADKPVVWPAKSYYYR
jgi:hypothetical protein